MIRKLTILLLLVYSCLSNAQEEWTLKRAVDHALEHNLTIKQSAYNVDFADIDLKQSKHARYPSLNGSTSINTNFGRSIDPVTNDFVNTTFLSNNFNLSTGVTLFNGFRISNTIKRSDLDKDAAGFDLEQTKRDIILSVVNNYLSVLFAEENLSIAQSQLATSEDQLDQVNRLIDAGVRPANESLDILAQIAQNEQGIINAENSRSISLLNLKQLLRLEPDVEITVVAPDNITSLLDPVNLSFEEVYNQALQSQPNIKAAQLREESARMGEKIAKAGLLPTIGIGANLGTNYSNQGRRVSGFNTVISDQTVIFQGNQATIGFEQDVPIFEDNPYFDQVDENLSYGFGLQMSVPIYNNRNVKSNIERSELNTLNVQIQNQQLKDNIKNTVQQALTDAIAAKKKLEASQKSVAAQQASFNNAEKRFNAGAINSFEYVTLKNALQQAQVNELISKYEYLFAQKVLDFYMGNPITI